MQTKEKSKVLIIDAMRSLGEKITQIAKDPITQILHYNSKKWIDVVDDETRDKTIKIFNLIKEIKPDKSSFIDRLLISLKEKRFVYNEENKWDYISKLNTNRSDLAVFIADLLEKSKHFNIYQVYRDLNVENLSSLKEFLNELPKHSKVIWEKFLNKKEKYTLNILKNSKEGEIVENLILEYLISKGWNLIYKGGDGELIDMLLSVDLIVEKENEYKLIQVKKVPSIENVVFNNIEFLKIKGTINIPNQSIIDTIGYGTLEGKIFIGSLQEYFHFSNDELITSYGFPIPNKKNKNEILVKNNF